MDIIENDILLNIERKEFVLKTIRRVLNDNNFFEVTTSTVRNDKHPMYDRFHAEGLGYLREEIEEPLKYLLQFKNRVFEIGSCYRREFSSPIRSLNNFLMLEFFVKEKGMFFIIEILKRIILEINPKVSFRTISVANYIKQDIDVDISGSNGEKLFIENISKNKSHDLKTYIEIANKYIEENIEPSQDSEECIILIDYPLCTNCTAKQKKGFIVERFEMFMNGVEIAHGCQEEDDLIKWQMNAINYGYYNSEEEYLYHSMIRNETPKYSSSLAMGIERLCMAIYNTKNINDFHITFPPRIGF